MRWRFWLVDLPARIVDTWFRVYWLLAFALTTICILTAGLSLALYLLGIRWGW